MNKSNLDELLTERDRAMQATSEDRDVEVLRSQIVQLKLNRNTEVASKRSTSELDASIAELEAERAQLQAKRFEARDEAKARVRAERRRHELDLRERMVESLRANTDAQLEAASAELLARMANDRTALRAIAAVLAERIEEARMRTLLEQLSPVQRAALAKAQHVALSGVESSEKIGAM